MALWRAMLASKTLPVADLGVAFRVEKGRREQVGATLPNRQTATPSNRRPRVTYALIRAPSLTPRAGRFHANDPARRSGTPSSRPLLQHLWR